MYDTSAVSSMWHSNLQSWALRVVANAAFCHLGTSRPSWFSWISRASTTRSCPSILKLAIDCNIFCQGLYRATSSRAMTFSIQIRYLTCQVFQGYHWVFYQSYISRLTQKQGAQLLNCEQVLFEYLKQPEPQTRQFTVFQQTTIASEMGILKAAGGLNKLSNHQ